MKCKLMIISISFIVLIVFSIKFLIDKNYLLSLIFILTSLVPIRLLFVSFSDYFSDQYLNIISVTIVALSILNSFNDSPLVDTNSITKNYEIIGNSVNIPYCTENEQPDKMKRDLFNSEKDKLLQKCALQHIADGAKLTINIAKSLYLDPIAGAADSIYSDIHPNHKLTCQELNIYLHKLCPKVMPTYN
ncbi:hypothetical protein C9J20_16320 [Photobacterium phosphoreum]|uniref:hypothetical protein n=1 Tax=Photobacterium phosphoreum TaxID=659 RepID=UPI000D16ED5F|nr:hypothetical protein [Photobacterium phosphoreum]MCD9505357.1 hypothetical protein [Photobacterium phosphoreum]PSU68984.1 hypothetical protein CTM79_11885 [Photobacterium phosphoreum]PSW09298.1 hypothetical protein C9J20_16320 [Photobacterium phosphoreum]